MRQSDDFPGTEQMDYEQWSALLRPLYGRHSLEGAESDSFAGWLRRLSVSGLTVVDICCNAHRFERTHRDVRLDDRDHYKAVFQVAGQSTIYQNDQCVHLAVGDVALIDVTRPMTCVSDDGSVRRLSFNLPRRSLVSNLGYEPQGGTYRRSGTPAGRLLYEVVFDALNGGRPIPTCSWQSMTCSAHCLHRPIRRRCPQAIRINCLCVSAASSRTALPIRISGLRKRHPKQGSRYATSRSSLHSAA